MTKSITVISIVVLINRFHNQTRTSRPARRWRARRNSNLQPPDPKCNKSLFSANIRVLTCFSLSATSCYVTKAVSIYHPALLFFKTLAGKFGVRQFSVTVRTTCSGAPAESRHLSPWLHSPGAIKGVARWATTSSAIRLASRPTRLESISSPVPSGVWRRSHWGLIGTSCCAGCAGGRQLFHLSRFVRPAAGVEASAASASMRLPATSKPIGLLPSIKHSGSHCKPRYRQS